MGIGLRLKMMLRDRGMTIKELSRKAGVSINTLYSITKRDSDTIDAAILQKISTALEISPGELIHYQPADRTGDTETFYSTLVFPSEIQAFRHFIGILGYQITSEDDRFFIESEEAKVEVPVDELSRLVRASEATVGALVLDLMTRYKKSPQG